MYVFWFGVVSFHIAVLARVPEFDPKKTLCANIVQLLDKTVWGRTTQ